MGSITYEQVRELVGQLPVNKLPIIYRLLIKLGASNEESSSAQQDFMLLSLTERRRVMAEQVKQVAEHYEETDPVRQTWQAGDFIEY